jgi:hypothetical protein
VVKTMANRVALVHKMVRSPVSKPGNKRASNPAGHLVRAIATVGSANS